MTTMTLDQQRRSLRQMARTDVMKRLRLACALLTLGLLAGGLFTRHPPYFMGALMSAVVWAAVWRSGPHLAHAAQALSDGQPEAGRLCIEVTRWSDADTFHATTWGGQSGGWRFEFIPLGWAPQAGEHAARLYLLPGLAWPAVVELPDGLLFARDTPQPVDRSLATSRDQGPVDRGV
jgi:hypothetical protein